MSVLANASWPLFFLLGGLRGLGLCPGYFRDTFRVPHREVLGESLAKPGFANMKKPHEASSSDENLCVLGVLHLNLDVKVRVTLGRWPARTRFML